MTREDVRQMRIHTASYKITKEEANQVWLAKDLSKKRELALEIRYSFRLKLFLSYRML